MDIFYHTERTEHRARRTIRIKGWTMSRPTFIKAVVTAVVVALLPVVIKLIVLVGQQFLAALQQQ
jgi:hypothetical protein